MRHHALSWLILFFLFFLSPTILAQKNTPTIQGVVRNAKQQNELLPFASILLPSANTGVLSDSAGRFQMTLPKKVKATDTLSISFLGYVKKNILVQNALSVDRLSIDLEPVLLEMDEIVTTTHPPTYYIKQAVLAKENYSYKPFYIINYFENNLYENKRFLTGSEMVFKTYYKEKLSPVFKKKKNRKFQAEQIHQLLLHRPKGNQIDLRFMKKELQKKQQKEAQRRKKKIKKEGGTINKEDSNFIIRLTPLFVPTHSSVLPFLDSNEFRQFTYTQREHCSKRNLRIIDFQSKHTYRISGIKLNGKGTVYIDCTNNAIAKIDVSANAKLSFFLRVALFVGFKKLKLNDINLSMSLEYQQQNNGYWYPLAVHYLASIDAEKVRWFAKNDKALLELSTALFTNEIITKAVQPIPQQKTFSFKTLNLQNDVRITWDDIQKIEHVLFYQKE